MSSSRLFVEIGVVEIKQEIPWNISKNTLLITSEQMKCFIEIAFPI